MSLQEATPRLVLASASVARRQLLAEAGLRFEVVPSAVDEAPIRQAARADARSADETALALAQLKATRASTHDRAALVIGCDQLLVCEGAWFEKPQTRAAAQADLLRLRGRWHVLPTAVVCVRGDVVLWRHVAQPKLLMRAFSDAFLESYLDDEAEHVTTCVGAYRIEATGLQLFDAVEGDYFSILGLPLLPLLGFLRQHGLLQT
jgi:septum formation protein